MTVFAALIAIPWGLEAALVFQAEAYTHYAPDEYMRWVEATPDGTGILIASDIKAGTAQRFEDLLAANPGVRTVHLLSNGGLAGDARTMAAAIRARGLDTVAVGSCASACTIIHAAGRSRFVRENGETLVYHSAGSVLLPDHWNGLGTTARDIFLAAGFAKGFVDRIETVPYYDVWAPTQDELLGSGAVHGLVSKRDMVGLRWMIMRKDPSDGFLNDRWFSRAIARAPAAQAALAGFGKAAWGRARNDFRVSDIRKAYVGRVLAAGLSADGVPEPALRKAGAFLLAAMQRVLAKGTKASPEDLGSCARMGASASFVEAQDVLPEPGMATAAPREAWRGLFAEALAGVAPGFEAGAAPMPPVDDERTWIEPSPASAETCADLVGWYGAAVGIDDTDGPDRLRRRFAAAARGEALGTQGRAMRPAMTSR